MRRVVVPGYPHHVTQRGNRRSNVFLDEDDREIFLRKLLKASESHSLQVYSFCLMTNHIHIVTNPEHELSLAGAMHELLGSYAVYFNQRYGLTGRLWQGRFYSCVLDESHFGAAMRYVECNPVRAGMVKRAEEYRWSSAPLHCGLTGEPVLTPPPFKPNPFPSWSDWLCVGPSGEDLRKIRLTTKTGRPLGSESFIDELEKKLGRPLRRRKGGRPRKKIQKTGETSP